MPTNQPWFLPSPLVTTSWIPLKFPSPQPQHQSFLFKKLFIIQYILIKVSPPSFPPRSSPPFPPFQPHAFFLPLLREQIGKSLLITDCILPASLLKLGSSSYVINKVKSRLFDWQTCSWLTPPHHSEVVFLSSAASALFFASGSELVSLLLSQISSKGSLHALLRHLSWPLALRGTIAHKSVSEIPGYVTISPR